MTKHMHEGRMAEVYGRNEGIERVFFIGYVAEKPEKEWCDGCVSNATGPYLRTVWDDELKGWVMEFGPPPCLAEPEPRGVCCCMPPCPNCGGVADEQRTNPGTFSGTAGIEW